MYRVIMTVLLALVHIKAFLKLVSHPHIHIRKHTRASHLIHFITTNTNRNINLHTPICTNYNLCRLSRPNLPNWVSLRKSQDLINGGHRSCAPLVFLTGMATKVDTNYLWSGALLLFSPVFQCNCGIETIIFTWCSLSMIQPFSWYCAFGHHQNRTALRYDT